MTWTADRLRGAPAALSERVAVLILTYGAREGRDPSADSLIAAAEHALRGVLSGGMARRETALELLAADALVTLAFEVAAGEGEEVEQRATAAMHRLAGAVPAS